MKRTTVALALLASAAGCTDLTAPTSSTGAASEPGLPAAPAPPAAAQALPAPAEGPDDVDAAAPLRRVRASHILISYRGVRMVKAERSKEEAKQLADQVLRRVRDARLDFATVARKFSDDPSAQRTGGDLGAFDRFTMAPAFTKAAFALKVGQISDVVETEFGFHVIKRTE